jgi:hypothetical protein
MNCTSFEDFRKVMLELDKDFFKRKIQIIEIEILLKEEPSRIIPHHIKSIKTYYPVDRFDLFISMLKKQFPEHIKIIDNYLLLL